jgi:hypothetical protein
MGIFINTNRLRSFGTCNFVTLKSVTNPYDFEHKER